MKNLLTGLRCLYRSCINKDGGLVYGDFAAPTKHCTIDYCQFLFLIRLEVKFP